MSSGYFPQKILISRFKSLSNYTIVCKSYEKLLQNFPLQNLFFWRINDTITSNLKREFYNKNMILFYSVFFLKKHYLV